MLNLTELKHGQDIYTNKYKAVNAKINDLKNTRTDNFAICFNNAANTAQKTSQSDYSKAEWEAQRKKNTAIGKLQRIDGDVAALERVAPNASEAVKSAWIDAARETGYNGLGYVDGNKESVATSLYGEMKESAKMTDNNISGVQDILGGTVDSAIDAINVAKYERNNSEITSANKAYVSKENAFYDSFLQKLNGLKDGSYVPGSSSTFDRMNKNNQDMFPQDDSTVSEKSDVPQNYYGSAFFHETTTVSENGEEHDLKAKYPDDYDPVNPVVEVYVTGNGQESLYKVNVNEVDPESASKTELYGLFAYVEDDRNVPRNIDPYSSDIYYSRLDGKIEKLKEESLVGQDESQMAGGFRTMDNLSYWDRRELIESVNSENENS
ncbi:hypothetical protein [Butyrivibrio sp. LC3010]|uniref:hypothetical protein n=1 Tax=Butyrivibrio sp. LC3010 TaxID=1280680 RepID=UPI000425C864|nr:hypothetical protein [Butyrivibrio sp. LC3010]